VGRIFSDTFAGIAPERPARLSSSERVRAY
jgi:hypothetical protein